MFNSVCSQFDRIADVVNQKLFDFMGTYNRANQSSAFSDDDFDKSVFRFLLIMNFQLLFAWTF